MAPNSFSPGTKILSSKVNENWTNFNDHGHWVTILWHFIGTLATGTGSQYIMLPDDATWERCNIVVATAPTGATIIVDIERSTDSGGSWATCFTTPGNRPAIAIGARVGNSTTIELPSATANSTLFRAKISQVGSTVAGADLTVMLSGKYNLD
jgi:hypothetical protein